VAAEQRARVPGLLKEGKLDRTVRVIERADALCPSSAPETWEALVTTLAEIGRGEDVRKVADAIDASAGATLAARVAAKQTREAIARVEGKTFDDKAKEAMRKAYLAAAAAREDKKYEEARKGFLKAWSLYRPNGQALWSAGLVAKEMGDGAGAQRLFDRAIVELEGVSGKKVVLDTPNGFTDRILALAWSRDGRWLAIAAAGVVSIRDRLLDLRETARLEGHTNWVYSVTFSPDGKTLASGFSDKSVRLWNVATGAEMRKLEGHTAIVIYVAFSPDGKTLASSSEDGSIRFWTAAGDPLVVLRVVSGRNTSYAFTPGPAPLIEFLGPEAEAATAFPLCRVGALSFPFDLCRERFEVHGLLTKVFAGDPSYGEP
jgi:WD domain, G-beta repeat